MSTGGHSNPVTDDHLGWLDGLKAAALAWIVLNHVVEPIAGFPYAGNPNANWPPLSERIAQLAPLDGLGVWTVPANLVRYVGWFGDQGVQLFIIASGFGLMWTALRKPWEGWSPYLRRRTGRVFPLWWTAHIAFLALSIGLAIVLGRFAYGMSPADPQFYASFAGIRFLPSTFYYGVPAWWYIGLALQLYLVFPYMANWLRRVGPTRFLVSVIIIGTGTRLGGLLIFETYLDAWARGAIFVTRVSEFALGMALAWWFAQDEHAMFRWLTRPTTLAGAALTYGLGTVLSLTLVGNAISPLLLGASAFVLLFGVFRRLGRRDSPRWLSHHSYSIYLTHQAFIIVAAEAAVVVGISTVLTGVALVVGVAISVLAALALEWAAATAGRTRRARGGRWMVTRAAIVVGLVAMVLIGAEWTVQQVAPQEVLGWGERPSLVASDELGWHLRPEATTELRWLGYDYMTESNSLGYPGPEPAVNRDALRIVTLGDAFTSAEGVDTDESWPRVLERALGGPGSGYEVVNLAITGYGPEQSAAIAESSFPQISPDVVLVGMFVNDYTDVDRSNGDFQKSIGFGRPDPFGSLATLQLSHLRSLVRSELIDPLVETATGKPDPGGYALASFEVLEAGGITASRALAVEHHLLRMVTAARDTGAAVLVVQIPAPVQVCGPAELDYYPAGIDLANGEFDLEAPQRTTREILDRLGVESLDLRDFLTGLPECPYFSFNMHWPSSTHQAVGEYIADQLRDWPALHAGH